MPDIALPVSYDNLKWVLLIPLSLRSKSASLEALSVLIKFKVLNYKRPLPEL